MCMLEKAGTRGRNRIFSTHFTTRTFSSFLNILHLDMSREMRFPTMWHFDKYRIIEPVQPPLSFETPNGVQSVA